MSFVYTLQLGNQHRWPLSIRQTSHKTGLRVAFPTEMRKEGKKKENVGQIIDEENIKWDFWFYRFSALGTRHCSAIGANQPLLARIRNDETRRALRE